MSTRTFKMTIEITTTVKDEWFEPGISDEEIIAIETESFLCYPEEWMDRFNHETTKVTMERIDK